MSDELLEPSSSQDPQPDSNVTQSLGLIFLEARKAKNLTQQDVSSELRLSLKQIEALEADNFSALPMPMITRGFIRNYARLLGVNAEPLLESYRKQVPEVLPNSISVQSSLHEVVPSPKKQSWDGVDVMTVFKGLLIALVVALFIWLIFAPKATPISEPIEGSDVVVEKAPAPPPTEQAVALPEIALPAAERQEEALDATSSDNSVNSAQAANPDQVGKLDQIDKKVQSAAEVKPAGDLSINTAVAKLNVTSEKPVPDAAVVKPSLPTATVDAKPVKPLEVQAPKKALISSTERSWVSVKDKSGKVVFERMLVPDTEYGFDGIPPFNVVIGNAKATKLVYLGKPVDLNGTSENNVAHPVLE